MNRRQQFFVLGCGLGCWLLAGASVPAQPLGVINPGFENDVLTLGSLLPSIGSGWTVIGSGSDPAGVWHPPAVAFPQGVPDGNNVAYSNGGVISQILNHVLVEGAYRLEVQVGARADLPFAGSTVQLLAGGVVVAEDQYSVSPGPGLFASSLVVASVLPFHPQIGQALEIRLSGAAAQVVFDSVTLVRMPLSARAERKVLAADGASQDEYGRSLSISGDAAIIGAPADGDNGPDSGSAYVIRRRNGRWAEEQKLLPAAGASGARFGNVVSINGDVAVIGAPYDVDGGIDSGSAYVFRRIGGAWIQEQKLLAADRASADLFGYSASVSGNVIVIGAPFDDDRGTSSGSAYVFRRTQGTWIEEQKLVPADGAPGDIGGLTVSVSGNLAVVGAPFDDDHGVQSGSAYVFRWISGFWIEEQKLLAGDGGPADELGSNVSASGEVVVLAASYDDDNGTNAGAAYVFRRVAGTWVEEQKLRASDGAAGDRLGFGVAVDGDLAVIGAPLDAGGGVLSGSAYVFRFVGGRWVEEQKLLANDRRSSDEFGFSVSVGGGSALAGARFGWGQASGSGTAHVFEAGDVPLDSRLLGRRAWGPLSLDPLTGNDHHFGVELLNGEGYVSARGLGGIAPHKIYVVDGQGFLLRSMDQVAATSGSPSGYRDGATDGVSLIFGFEAGLHIVNPLTGALVTSLQSANGPQPVVNPIVAGTASAPRLAITRAVAYDPAGNGGNGSVWVADLGSDLFEIDLAGNILRQWAHGSGWSIEGLAFDPVTGRLWATEAGSIVEIDPATGAPTGIRIPRHDPDSAPGGLCGVVGGLQGSGGFDLLALDRAFPDQIVGYRIHTDATVDGTREASLRCAVGNGPWTRQSAIVAAPGEILHLGFDLSADPLVLSGRPVAVFVSLLGDAFVNATTFGIPEFLIPIGNGSTSFSTPAPLVPPFVIGDGLGIAVLTGTPAPLGLDSLSTSLALPLTGQLPPLRVQGLYLENGIPAGPPLKSTNALRIN